MTRDPFYRLVFLLSIFAAIVIGAVLLRWWLFPLTPLVPIQPTQQPLIVLPTATGAPPVAPTLTVTPEPDPVLQATSTRVPPTPTATSTPEPAETPRPPTPERPVQKG